MKAGYINGEKVYANRQYSDNWQNDTEKKFFIIKHKDIVRTLNKILVEAETADSSVLGAPGGPGSAIFAILIQLAECKVNIPFQIRYEKDLNFDDPKKLKRQKAQQKKTETSLRGLRVIAGGLQTMP